MTILYRSALVLFVTLLARVGQSNAQEVRWQEAKSLEIEGMGWSATAGAFDRLPDSAKSKVNEVAWAQSKDSAGICVRFVTDAPSVSVRWTLTKAELDMPHMPATGCSGLDLYVRAAPAPDAAARQKDGASGWRFIGNCRPAKQDGNLSTIEFLEGVAVSGGESPLRECLLYLPLYNGTASLEIGIPTGHRLEKPPARPESQRRSIAVYGTSITQGGCASRPGMAWPAILGRLLDRPVINLGFSASGDMASPVGEVLAELDPAAYVIDCAWNMGDSQEVYLQRTKALVQSLRAAHPSTPILFIGQSLIHPEAHPTDLTRRLEIAVKRLQDEGATGLTMVPAADLIGHDGEGTVDGVHYNDLGMHRQAQHLLPIVRDAIDPAGSVH